MYYLPNSLCMLKYNLGEFLSNLGQWSNFENSIRSPLSTHRHTHTHTNTLQWHCKARQAQVEFRDFI